MKTTIDGLLNKRILLEQPAEGYRVAVDTVLLASAVPAIAGEKVLDMGCGVGGAMMCLACRVPDLDITGIEIQDELVKLCSANIERNNFGRSMRVEKGNVTNLSDSMLGAFDHVIMNPPYHNIRGHNLSPNEIKKIANAEVEGSLDGWIENACKAINERGTITLIHRADVLDRITALLKNRFNCIEIKPINSNIGSEAKRVLVRAKSGVDCGIKTCAPLIMHGCDAKYSDDAEKILRHICAINFN